MMPKKGSPSSVGGRSILNRTKGKLWSWWRNLNQKQVSTYSSNQNTAQGSVSQQHIMCVNFIVCYDERWYNLQLYNLL